MVFNRIADKPIKYDIRHSEGLLWCLSRELLMRTDRDHFWFVARNERILNLLQSSFTKYQSISYLEVGCGIGTVAGFLKESGIKDVTGYDISEDAINKCRVRYPEVKFEVKDFLSCDIEKHTYDAVGVFDCLEHLESEIPFLNQAYETLKPGGKLIVTVPAFSFLWSHIDTISGHYRRYNKKGLHKVLKNCGFTDIKLTYMMAPLMPFMLARQFRFKDIENENNQVLIDDLLNDLSTPKKLVNTIATAILRMEHKLFKTNDLGFGTSLIGTCCKPN
jgi:SAM-dependent methyltransferase